eukprot:11883985-Prorocentrum_lima.AAC.1
MAQKTLPVPVLVCLLNSGTPVAKEKAAGALKNLSVNADNHVLIAREEKAVPALVRLLDSGRPVAK